MLAAHVMQANQQVTFPTDGGEDFRDLTRYLSPDFEHLLDWFHITMRITVMTQLAKGLRTPPELSINVVEQLQRLKWFLSYGNTSHALKIIENITCDLEDEDPPVGQSKLLKALAEFGGYIRANAGSIPND